MRIHSSVSIAVICALLVGYFLLLNGTGMISKRIGEVVRTPGSTEVDLAKLTTFGWESFPVLKPGTPRAEVCRLIEIRPEGCDGLVRVEKVPDDHMYLVFALGNRFTHLELHALENGQFALASNGARYFRGQSVFKIRRSPNGSGKGTIQLELK
jgi:hypothetical protein